MNTASPLASVKDRFATLAHEFSNFYDSKHTSYKELNEFETRKYFIDKFWEILGWNTDNRFIFAKAIRTMHFDSPVTNRIPYPKLNLLQHSDKQEHDKIVQLVQKMLETQAKRKTARTDFEREQLEQSASRIDREIDAVVYRLYGLTAEEIALVERGA
ncbi:MAG: hypothetical protein EAZ92_03700 [Candidatus Kapaibacterium sp.]|nr:MAG: hypothetical protein EAZ92_03700 [Candidatus Kapabacteria bacterium]